MRTTTLKLCIFGKPSFIYSETIFKRQRREI
nr:MAG TPA_asm: hypothetical protein [Caudoviricetes sp.]DAP99678.1 MAG TPA: hypothetical protein [Caudoviricetes sp.]